MPIGKLAAIAINLAIAGGSMAVSYLLQPKVQGTSTDQGKLDDIRITGSEYGNLIPRVWGNVRLAGNVVWSSGIRHDILQYQSSGGKGAMPGTSTTTHVYKADLGLQICRGPVQAFGRIWADSDVISNENFSTGEVEAELYVTSGGTVGIDTLGTLYPSSAGQWAKTLGSIKIYAPDLYFIKRPENPEPDVTQTARSLVGIYYRANATTKLKVECWDEAVGTKLYDSVVTLPATPNSGNSWQIHMIQIDDTNSQFVGQIFLSKSGSDAAPDVDRIGLSKQWFATIKSSNIYTPVTGIKDPYLLFDDTALDTAPYFRYTAPFNALGYSEAQILPANIRRTFNGTNYQGTDPSFITWLDSKYGDGNGVSYAMAYRDTVMIVFEDYNLSAGRIPNYTFEIFEQTHNFGDMLPTVLEECGLTSGQYDLSEIEDILFIGIVEPPRQSKKAFLENLGRYFGFRMFESDGKLQFILDNEFTSVGSLSSDVLRARMEGEELKPYDAEYLCSPAQELPREMRFNIMNPQMDYHNDTVTASLFADIASADSQEFNFPIVDYPYNARLRAENALLKAYAENQMVTFTAMPEALKYSLGDVIDVTINELPLTVRIEKMTIGMPIGTVQIEASVIEAFDAAEIVVSVTNQNTTTNRMATKLLNPRNVDIVTITSYPVRGKDKGRLGCYIAVSPIGTGAIDNIALYREAGPENYILLDILDVPATVGITDDALEDWADPIDEDIDSNVTINFYNTVSLESFTSTDLDRYPTLNLINIGGEWVQYRTATAQTLPADSKYRSSWLLTNFKRGLFGTTGYIPTHSSGEKAVMWSDTLKFYDLNPEDVGETVILKATAGGALIEDAKAFDFTFSPISKYAISNDTTDRTLNANSTDMDELADVLSTLVRDSNL